MKKLQYIQEWRGVAILLVLLAHSARHHISKSPDNIYVEKLVSFGGQGVSLFFVLSAFTLFYVQDHSTGSFNKWTFFIKRFFRIAPLIYLGLLIYGLLIYKNLHSGLDIFINIIFLSWLKPSAIYNGVPGGWSITTEFTFYYLFPFIYPLLVKQQNTLRWCLIAILGSRILVAIYARIYPGLEAYMYELNPLVQFPIFFIGILLYQKIAGKKIKIETLDLLLISVIVILHFLFIGFMIRDYVIYAGVFALLIYCNSFHKVNIPFVNPLLSFIGELSFTIYISHFAVTDLLITKIFPFEDGSTLGLISRFSTLLVVSLAISIPIYYLIEKPLINFGKSLALKATPHASTNY